jgi:hypothetical protein
MSRTAGRKDQPQPADNGDSGLVRTEKAIPSMDQWPLMKPAPQESQPLPCTGRCGHCHLDPCQLHAPI